MMAAPMDEDGKGTDDTDTYDDGYDENEQIIGTLINRVLDVEQTQRKQGFQLKVLMGGLVLTGFGFVFVNKLLTNIVGAINGAQQAQVPSAVTEQAPIDPTYERTMQSREGVPTRIMGERIVVDETVPPDAPMSAPQAYPPEGHTEPSFGDMVADRSWVDAAGNRHDPLPPR
jgi:hypothetical protein